MTDTLRKKQIDEIIEAYRAGPFYVNLPNGDVIHEWEAFLRGKKEKLKLQEDKFSSTGKGEHVIERGITDIPSTLYVTFQRLLPSDDNKWFESTKGKYWIAKHYKELRFGENL